jgi:hypothetical protein
MAAVVRLPAGRVVDGPATCEGALRPVDAGLAQTPQRRGGGPEVLRSGFRRGARAESAGPQACPAPEVWQCWRATISEIVVSDVLKKEVCDVFDELD